MMTSVLYVDDEPTLLEIGKLFLEQCGQFSVDTIPSAPAAITQLNTKQYDAIVSDYQMPDMDGIEFLKKVRTSGNTIPFILFTGRGREEVVIQALNEGADFYLQKGGEPVPQFTELAHKIRQAVQKRQADASVRDLERREADILNFLPDATFAIDAGGVVISWNQAMEELTGVTAAEILGKGNYEYAIPAYHERRPILIDLVLTEDPALLKQYPRVKRVGRTLFTETTAPFLFNGRGATLWITATPLHNTQGTVIGAIQSIRDITQRKEAEVELYRKHEELNVAYNQLRAQENELKQQMNDIIASQSALHESEEKYRVLIENAGECIVIEQGEYLKFVNQRVIEVTGYSKDELLSRPFFEFLHPDDRDMIAARYQHGQSGDQLGVNTFRHVRKDGVVRIMEIRTVPTLWRGTPAALNLIMDITEQKKAEEALRESEIRFRERFQNNPLALITWQYREGDFVLIDCNHATEILTGGRSKDYIGTTVSDLYALRPEIMAVFKQCFIERTVISKDLLSEHLLPGKLIHITAAFVPPDLIMVHLDDITKLKLAENALRESEERYRNVVEDQTEFICRFLPDGTHIFVNDAYCCYVGLNRDEILGHKFRPQIPDEDRECVRQFFEFLTPGHPVDTIEHRIITPDGSIRWQWWSDRAIFDNDGHIREYQSVGRDITEQKTLENSLRTTQIILTEAMDLAHMASWELNDQTSIFIFNDRFYAMYGTTAEREGGYQIPADVYFREFVHPDDRDRIITAVKSATEISDPHHVWQLEHRIIRRDGEIRHIIVRIERTMDRQRRVITIHGVNQDITEH